ncbi:MAG: beta strand repeat-containing protein [Flavobacteriales bacterium]
MKKITTLLLACLMQCIQTFAQSPYGFNYQAALRTSQGELASSTPVIVRISLHAETLDGAIIYQEEHDAITTNLGLINLVIGEGNAIVGVFENLDWSANSAYFIQIEIDLGEGMIDTGTQQLMSVPFAIIARKATDVLLNELDDVNTTGATLGQTLKWNGSEWIPSPDNGTTYVAGSGISITGNSIVNTGDVSSTNEIQSLTLNGTNLSLSNGGGSVTLPTGTTYSEGSGIDIIGNTISANDASATNEIQALTLNGTNLSLSNGGGSVTLPTGTTYTEGSGIDIIGNTISANDASATNEIQALTLNGTNLSLSNGGGSVTLPTGTTYTEGSGIDIVGNTISANDASATNEIQSLSISGSTISLSNGGGSIAIPDASVTNEIQSLTLNGTNLSLSNGGGSVTLPTGTTYTEGIGIDIVGNTISANDASATNEIQSLTLNGTNLSLSNGGGSVTLPTGTTYTAGTGISISGNTISNSGDTDATNDITNITPHSGDVTGLYNNLQIASNAVSSAEIANDAVTATEIANGAVGATELAQMGATAGQILEWDGLAWSPQTPASTADGVWSSNATNAWRLGGNVGIGTSTPANGLHLHNKQGLRLTTTFTGSSFLDGFYIGQDSDNSNVYLSNFENGSILFQTNFAERMRIAGDGNIGIGTQFPVAPLHLANLNVGSDVYSKWTTPITGHTQTDGAHVGVNTVGQMVIDQKENYDILVKRNGSTKVTVNSTGVDVNGDLTSEDVTTGTVTAVGAAITSVNSFITTTENLYVNSATGTGSRPLFATADGQVYANNLSSSTQYLTFMGVAFHFDDECYDNFVVYENWDIDHPAIGHNGDCGRAYCPINLPQGAVVTKLTARFKDDADGQQFALLLRKYNISDETSWANLAVVYSATSDSYVAASTTNITSPTINNNGYAYTLVLTPNTDDIPTTGWMYMLSATVEYYIP